MTDVLTTRENPYSELQLGENSFSGNPPYGQYDILPAEAPLEVMQQYSDIVFLGYNLAGKTLPAGKHAILRIGDADIADIRLSDAAGRAVIAEQGDVTGIEKISNEELGNRNERTGNKAVYDLEGRKISNLKSQTSKGVYIIDGKKVKK